MGKKKRVPAQTASMVHDGKLTQAEALEALRIAAQAATEALPAALKQCQTDSERSKVQADRDTVMLAYLNSLKKTLVNTGALFENMAEDLKKVAKDVAEKAEKLKNASEAINLLADLVRLAASLALAFA
ncbi:MAG: hypothetical protein HY694_03870 [Deltaproteobacteria bacterium]|nr:hypothetical protein [Deltaproteobacteria bacterium]